jgi:hypothetical protein
MTNVSVLLVADEYLMLHVVIVLWIRTPCQLKYR